MLEIQESALFIFVKAVRSVKIFKVRSNFPYGMELFCENLGPKILFKICPILTNLYQFWLVRGKKRHNV